MAPVLYLYLRTQYNFPREGGGGRVRGGSGGEVATVLNCDWVISFNKKNSFSSEKGSACFQFEKVVYSFRSNNIHLMHAHRFFTQPVLTVSPKEYTASKTESYPE